VAGGTSRATAPFSAEFADRTRRQIALRLLPFLFILYITSYLDRTSVAFAAIGMARDLGFNDRVFGLGSGIFFVSYLALQIPGALLVERWSARRMISATMIIWGSLTSLTALVHTPAQLYFARFVLGAAEAGFFPGVIVHLSHWFIQEDRAKATSNFMAAIPFSLLIGSPIGGWILGHEWLKVAGWRWLFVLEGLPAILLGIVAFFFLTDWPSEAAWLASSQRLWIENRLQNEKLTDAQPVTAWQVLYSPVVLLLASVTFLEYFVGYTFNFWLPTLLKRISGSSDVRVGLLAALPYAAGFILMQVNGWHSDRSGERRWHSAVPLFIVATALLGLSVQAGSPYVVVALFTMVGVNVAFLPAFWAIPTEILSNSTAAAAVGMINAVGSVAGFAGPYAFGYLNSRSGSPSTGFTVLACCAFVAGILMLLTPTTAHPRARGFSHGEATSPASVP
jgi:MFS transporter, ACS family, tartrate transporter